MKRHLDEYWGKGFVDTFRCKSCLRLSQGVLPKMKGPHLCPCGGTEHDILPRPTFNLPRETRKEATRISQ